LHRPPRPASARDRLAFAACVAAVAVAPLAVAAIALRGLVRGR
jgi:hypothetical protein